MSHKRRIKAVKHFSFRQALHNLRRFTDLRNYRIGDEMVSPAEDWLISTIYRFDPVKPDDSDRGLKLRLIEHAKILGHYPIPDWWLVKNRLTQARGPSVKFEVVDDAGNILKEWGENFDGSSYKAIK